MPYLYIEPSAHALALAAKRFFMGSRNVMEAMLRQHDLGQTQWMVLDLLAANGSMPQGELVRRLDIERASLSAIVAALTSKGFVVQEPMPGDGRRKLIRLSSTGEQLWAALPDPVALIVDVAFRGTDQDEIAMAYGVLDEATRRLAAYREEVR